MDQIPENITLVELFRQYAEYIIPREEFCKQRRHLLDQVDAKYNGKHHTAKELVLDVKNKIKDALGALKAKN